MSRHIHIHLERRQVRDKQDLIYYTDVPEKDFKTMQIGKWYKFGTYSGTVLGKRRGEFSGRPQVLVRWDDRATA